MGDPIAVSGFGKLSVAGDASAPLLVVFGGIDVGGVQSGIYMWKYLSGAKDRFHVFVANNNTVNGSRAYRALMKVLEGKEIRPAKQILYLFSGGYRPGMDLLPDVGPATFSSIYLVDIWMGVTKKSGSVVPDFYEKLADANATMITYVYTKSGANNDKARDYIAGKVRAMKVDGSGMSAHMATNTTAVNDLP